MAVMTSRLTKVESLLRNATAEIMDKDQTIRKQRERLSAYEMVQKAQSDESTVVAELNKKLAKLQQQCHEMEGFLADYGMIWIGDNEDDDDISPPAPPAPAPATAPILAPAPAPAAAGAPGMWSPAMSVPDGATPTAPAAGFVCDYDKIVSNVKDLNALAGEGVGGVETDRHGAKRIVMQTAIPLRLFSNGIMLFEGPFRPFEDAETLACIQDLTEGYFPSELQQRYPDGVPFELFDFRAQPYSAAMAKSFQGTGHTLGGDHKPSRLVPGQAAPRKSGAHGGNIRTIRDTASGAVPTSSAEAFLNRLPKNVIRGGKIIDIRGGIAEALNGPDAGPQKVAIVETPVFSEMRKRVEAADSNPDRASERPSTPGDIATIQVKTKDNQKLILKLRFNDTVEMLRKCIDTHLHGSGGAYKLQTSFPRKVLDDAAITLLDAGLTPSATVHMR